MSRQSPLCLVHKTPMTYNSYDWVYHCRCGIRARKDLNLESTIYALPDGRVISSLQDISDAELKSLEAVS